MKKNSHTLLEKSISKRPKNFFPVFAGVLFLDQLLKYIFLKSGQFQKNYAALFGFAVDPLLSTGALILFLVGTSYYLRNRKDAALFAVPLALILAGIFSNTIDRLRAGFIIDYIRLSDIYVFNLADLAILLGATFFIWRIIKK